MQLQLSQNFKPFSLCSSWITASAFTAIYLSVAVLPNKRRTWRLERTLNIKAFESNLMNSQIQTMGLREDTVVHFIG